MQRVFLISLHKPVNPIYFDPWLVYLAGAVKECRLPYASCETPVLAKGQDAALEFFSGWSGGQTIVISSLFGYASYRLSKEFAFWSRKTWPESKIYMAGALAKYCPDEVLANLPIDASILDIHKNSVCQIIKGGRGTAHPQPGPLQGQNETCRLSLALPCVEHLDMKKLRRLLHKTGMCWNLIGSQGCPHACVYCYRRQSRPIYRDVYEIIREIKYMERQFNISRFNFLDDNFLNDPSQVDAFCEALKGNGNGTGFRFQGRVDRLNRDMLAKLKDCGLLGVSFGIESGSTRILAEMKKGFDIEKADTTLATCRDMGIDYHASFILGMPGEDLNSVRDTRYFLKRNNFKRNYRICFLTPAPGTPVFQLARERGLVKDTERYLTSLNRIYDKPVVDLTGHGTKWLIAQKRALKDF
jgi:hypothetical protein